MLSVKLLEEFESRLRQQGVPAADAAQPGLSAAEISESVSPLGLSLPHEAMLWWEWHDGVPADADAWQIAPGRRALPLSEAVNECRRIRVMTATVAARDHLDPERLWSPTWFPLIAYDGLYAVDASGPKDAPCPVRIHWFDEPNSPNDLTSIGELVSLWIEAFDRGVWTFDPNKNQWVIDHDLHEAWPAAKRGLV